MELPHALHRATPAELKARLKAEREGRPFVYYRDGDGVQRIEPLPAPADRLVIGRSDANDIALPWDDEVSRVHATLERLGDEWSLVDDGRSRNGSFIDGVRVTGRARLRDGDAIGIGRTVIVFRSPEPVELQRTTVARRDADAPPTVSEAQHRVLVALCRPYADREYAVPASNREIATELTLGVETIKTHMRALFDVFGVGDQPQHQKRAALAQRALATGVVRLRDLRG